MIPAIAACVVVAVLAWGTVAPVTAAFGRFLDERE